jgi:hypothetical protein
MLPPTFHPSLELPGEALEVNRQYWLSNGSVNGIADHLEISKGRIYELLLPLDAEHPCPSCGGPLGFAHRTARDRGEVGCPGCGLQGSLDSLASMDPPPASRAGDPKMRDRAHEPEEGRGLGMLLGGLLAGVALGLLLGRWRDGKRGEGE